MKFGNKGFSSVLNTNPKLIFPYEPTGVGGIIYHNNGVHPNLMKFGTIGFPGVLNTNPKLIFQYDPTPPSHRRGGGLVGQNIINIFPIWPRWNSELKWFAVSWRQYWSDFLYVSTRLVFITNDVNVLYWSLYHKCSDFGAELRPGGVGGGAYHPPHTKNFHILTFHIST